MSDYTIKEENPKRNNFTILQNILSKIGLTAIERSVYWAIKECAGEKGSCTKSQPNLAEMAGVGPTCLKETIVKLSLPNKILGKSLIKIIHRVLETNVKNTNEILVVDLWDDNVKIFKEKIYQSSRDSHKSPNEGGVSRQATEGRSPRDYNKEPLKNVSKKQQQAVAVFFECLKNENRLTDKEKSSIMETGASEERIKLAIEYSNTAKIKKTRVATILWHCTFEEIVQPKINRKSLSEELKRQFKHNEKYSDATCYYQDEYIAFERGMTNLKAFVNSEDQVKKILDRFGIKFEYEWTKN